LIVTNLIGKVVFENEIIMMMMMMIISININCTGLINVSPD
jgi:hypothetical protein